ncbi:MAG TPA: ABC transporter permease subunit, partial [Arthrobacter sp.]
MNGSAPGTDSPTKAPAAVDDTATDSTATGRTTVQDLKTLARRRSFGVWFRDKGWRHVVGIAVTLFAIFPLLYVLSAAFNSTGTLVGSNALFSRIDFGNFTALFNDPSRPYARWFVNTMVVGVVTSAATVFLGAMAAYAFSRMRFKGRRIGLLSLLLLQMFPQLLAVVAIFLLLSGISEVIPALGLGSQLGLIMVYLGGALGVNTYLMYGFFNTVPQSLDEAAKIDGASHTQIFFGIIMRLVTPILA